MFLNSKHQLIIFQMLFMKRLPNRGEGSNVGHALFTYSGGNFVAKHLSLLKAITRQRGIDSVLKNCTYVNFSQLFSRQKNAQIDEQPGRFYIASGRSQRHYLSVSGA